VEDYRRVARPAEVLSVRLDYQRLREAMNSGAAVTPHMLPMVPAWCGA
jgi:hypothetical protein